MRNEIIENTVSAFLIPFCCLALDGGGGLDDLVSALTDPGAVQEIEATLGPAPEDPTAYTQYVFFCLKFVFLIGNLQVHANQVRLRAKGEGGGGRDQARAEPPPRTLQLPKPGRLQTRTPSFVWLLLS